MRCFIPQIRKVPPPCKVANNIIAVPSQMWYLTEASNWMPINRNIDIPLKMGRRRRARQASANKPHLVATLKILYCHLEMAELENIIREYSDNCFENDAIIFAWEYRNILTRAK